MCLRIKEASSKKQIDFYLLLPSLLLYYFNISTYSLSPYSSTP